MAGLVLRRVYLDSQQGFQVIGAENGFHRHLLLSPTKDLLSQRSLTKGSLLSQFANPLGCLQRVENAEQLQFGTEAKRLQRASPKGLAGKR